MRLGTNLTIHLKQGWKTNEFNNNYYFTQTTMCSGRFYYFVHSTVMINGRWKPIGLIFDLTPAIHRPKKNVLDIRVVRLLVHAGASGACCRRLEKMEAMAFSRHFHISMTTCAARVDLLLVDELRRSRVFGESCCTSPARNAAHRFRHLRLSRMIRQSLLSQG
jgi:hypothetical protein